MNIGWRFAVIQLLFKKLGLADNLIEYVTGEQ